MAWGRVVLRVEAPAPVVMLGMAMAGLYGAWKVYKALPVAEGGDITLTAFTSLAEAPSDTMDDEWFEEEPEEFRFGFR